jgi:hypothetical protein
MPRSTASEIWRSECEAINQEMDRLLLSDWPRTQEENQVRKIRFMALVERRSDAACNFLLEAAVKRPINWTECKLSRVMALVMNEYRENAGECGSQRSPNANCGVQRAILLSIVARRSIL